MEEISFEELRKIHLEEKHSPLLSQLPENFFDIYLQHIDTFYSKLKDVFSMEGSKTYENSRKVFGELVRLRGQKLILKAFKDSKSGGVSSEGLATQEKELYLSMLKLFTEYDSSLLGFKPVPQVESTVEKSVKIELLVDLPQFVSPSGNTIGPFEKGSVVEVDVPTRKILGEQGACKAV
ncbi:MAG: hypothetical protein Q8R15_04775 [Candidatus Micrarchaeota archaeon]|nr:hypothetical protein [Candidatus Micrarchaeota archaeon]